MKKSRIVLVVAVCLLTSSAAQAGPVLDQFMTQETRLGFIVTTGPRAVWAQTFTAGLSGVLDHVDLGNTSGADCFPVSAPVVEIWNTTTGRPGPTVLGSVVSPDLVPVDGWLSVDFSDLGIGLTAGEVYAIAFYPQAPNSSIILGAKWDPAAYELGALWEYTGTSWVRSTGGGGGADMQFRTYMQVGPAVPAPGAIVLGTLGAGLVGWLRRRRTL